VHEETGWLVDPPSLRRLGWLHMELLTPRPPDWPYPYPDFLQVVYVGRASERDADGDQPWPDTEGYELTSCLLSLADAREVVEAASLARVFLDLLG
jgi:hypothetical protein